MDEILASIRRILNEDSVTKTQSAPADEGVLMLNSSMLVNEEAMTADSDVPTAAIPAAPATPASSVIGGYTPTAYQIHPPLVAPEAAAAASSSVGELVRTLTNNRGASVSRNGPTLEDLVRDEIRPVLKTWLDEHLPPIVERLVRIEIERVISRMTP